MTELLALFALLKSSMILNLLTAIEDCRTIRGRYYEHGDRKGCLVYWLSGCSIFSREDRDVWIAEIAGKRNVDDVRKLVAQVISNWDSVEPHAIIKGAGYDKEYPPATCQLTADQVRTAAKAVLLRRRERRRTGAVRRGKMRSEAFVNTVAVGRETVLA